MEDLTPEKSGRVMSSENLVVLDSVLKDEGIIYYIITRPLL